MKIMTAVESLSKIERPAVFLAGGITNCPEWQDYVIEKLKDLEIGTLLNPRRKNFPIHDPNASKEQITWEFRALERADIFSMWFSNAPSDQPICFYELGRHLAIKESLMDFDTIVIGVEKGFKREQDVHIQTGLVCPTIPIYDNLDDYIEGIKKVIMIFASSELKSLFF